MKQIFVANPKGGCGKSTVSAQLASYFAGLGYSVALVDHDRQRSSLDWLKARPQSYAGIVPVAAFKGESVDTDFDVAIHDMPAGMGVEELKQHWVEGSKLLVPLLPSPTDLKACVRYLMAINRDADLSRPGAVAIVANRVKRNTSFVRVLDAFVAQLNIPFLTSIRDTQNYIRATERGVSVFDLPPSRVKADRDQWQPVLDWVQA